jgi:hypothetical protein
MRGKSNTPSFKEMEREAWHQKAPDYHDRGGRCRREPGKSLGQT